MHVTLLYDNVQQKFGRFELDYSQEISYSELLSFFVSKFSAQYHISLDHDLLSLVSQHGQSGLVLTYSPAVYDAIEFRVVCQDSVPRLPVFRMLAARQSESPDRGTAGAAASGQDASFSPVSNGQLDDALFSYGSVPDSASQNYSPYTCTYPFHNTCTAFPLDTSLGQASCPPTRHNNPMNIERSCCLDSSGAAALNPPLAGLQESHRPPQASKAIGETDPKTDDPWKINRLDRQSKNASSAVQPILPTPEVVPPAPAPAPQLPSVSPAPAAEVQPAPAPASASAVAAAPPTDRVTVVRRGMDNGKSETASSLKSVCYEPSLASHLKLSSSKSKRKNGGNKQRLPPAVVALASKNGAEEVLASPVCALEDESAESQPVARLASAESQSEGAVERASSDSMPKEPQEAQPEDRVPPVPPKKASLKESSEAPAASATSSKKPTARSQRKRRTKAKGESQASSGASEDKNDYSDLFSRCSQMLEPYFSPQEKNRRVFNINDFAFFAESGTEFITKSDSDQVPPMAISLFAQRYELYGLPGFTDSNHEEVKSFLLHSSSSKNNLQERLLRQRISTIMNPTDLGGWLNLSLLYFRTKRYMLCEQAVRNLLILCPTYPLGWAWYGYLLLDQGQYTNSMLAYRQALLFIDLSDTSFYINTLSYYTFAMAHIPEMKCFLTQFVHHIQNLVTQVAGKPEDYRFISYAIFNIERIWNGPVVRNAPASGTPIHRQIAACLGCLIDDEIDFSFLQQLFVRSLSDKQGLEYARRLYRNRPHFLRFWVDVIRRFGTPKLLQSVYEYLLQPPITVNELVLIVSLYFSHISPQSEYLINAQLYQDVIIYFRRFLSYHRNETVYGISLGRLLLILSEIQIDIRLFSNFQMSSTFSFDTPELRSSVEMHNKQFLKVPDMGRYRGLMIPYLSDSREVMKHHTEEEMFLEMLMLCAEALYLCGDIAVLFCFSEELDHCRSNIGILVFYSNFFSIIMTFPRIEPCFTDVLIPQSIPEIQLIGCLSALSLSWRIIPIHGKRTLLRPHIVNEFYLSDLVCHPTQFTQEFCSHLLDAIPRNAVVLWNLGECDINGGFQSVVSAGAACDIIKLISNCVSQYIDMVVKSRESNIFSVILAPGTSESCYLPFAKLFSTFLSQECSQRGIPFIPADPESDPAFEKFLNEEEEYTANAFVKELESLVPAKRLTLPK